MMQDIGGIDSQSIQAILDRFDKIVTSDITARPPTIAVVGAFSRGKSALINALIGLPLLPVHPLPTTALPTRLVYADMLHAAVLYPDREQPIAVDDLEDFSLSQGDTSRLCDAVGLKIGCPSPLLSLGINLLDTPGINAPDAEALLITDEVAALIVVFAADPPIGADELAFFAELVWQVPYVIWVQTKVDLLSDTDLLAATQFNQSAIDRCGAEPSATITAIYSVSTKTGIGLEPLLSALKLFSADNLRLMRQGWRLKIARDHAQPVLQFLTKKQYHLNRVREQITGTETALDLDFEDIRTGVLSTLTHLSEYVLGNLSETIYRTEPATLSGSRGINMASEALVHVRDQLINEIDQALSTLRQTATESLNQLWLPGDTFPAVPKLALPNTRQQVVMIRIAERRRFGPSTIDVNQTIKAYRIAVAHMSDEYAARLAPILENFLDGWKAQISAWFTDQRLELSAEFKKVDKWLDSLRARF